MKSWHASIAVAAVGLLVVASQWAQGQPALAPPPAEDEERTLLKERLAVLEQIVEGVIARHKSGNADMKAVLEAQEEVARAKLELAESPAERIAALEELLALATRAEKTAAAQHEAVLVSKMDVLIATAHRLRVAADLAKEKKKK